MVTLGLRAQRIRGGLGCLVALLVPCCGPGAVYTDVSALSIAGGTLAAAQDVGALSTVSLLKADGFAFCTGALISPQRVLTAAHCVAGLSGDIFVGFGVEARLAVRRPVARLTLHEGFDSAALDKENAPRPPNDLALIYLGEGAPPAFVPLPILADDAVVTVGETLTLLGFGVTHAELADSGQLRQVEARLLSTEAAAKEIIVGDAAGTAFKGACLGDSGGPALLRRGAAVLLAGVTSRGSGDCAGLSVETDLRAFRDWLSSK